MGVLADTKLTGSQQCALVTTKANHILGCIQQSVPLPLLSTGEATSGVPCPVAPECRKDRDILERVQQRARKMIKRLQHLCCEERLTGPSNPHHSMILNDVLKSIKDLHF